MVRALWLWSFAARWALLGQLRCRASDAPLGGRTRSATCFSAVSRCTETPTSARRPTISAMLRLVEPLLLVLLSSTHDQLAQQVQFLRAESRMLRERLLGRSRLTESERRTLVRLGSALGSVLREIITIVQCERQNTTDWPKVVSVHDGIEFNVPRLRAIPPEVGVCRHGHRLWPDSHCRGRRSASATVAFHLAESYRFTSPIGE